MTGIKETSPETLIKEAAKRLQSLDAIKPPAWTTIAKTGVSRERPPQQKDWWFIRAAAILRKLHAGKGMGVSKLRRHYSGRKRRGHKPEHAYPGSGAVARKILQQLEAAGLLKSVKGMGRVITPQGKTLLRDAAKAAGGEGK